MASSSPTQHAVRLLILLDQCGGECGGGDPQDSVRAIRSERRMQALDFWLRNPDYLADEVLTLVESRVLDADQCEVARHLLDDPEPALHYYPMPKWLFGAYERLDDAFAILEAHGLALVRREGAPPRPDRSDFFLTAAGSQAASRLRDDPVLSWYPRQARLVAAVAGTDSGSRLKQRQYQQREYAETALGGSIGSIAARVRNRLRALEDRTVGGAA